MAFLLIGPCIWHRDTMTFYFYQNTAAVEAGSNLA